MSHIRYDQARAVVRLVNEAHEIGGSERAHHLIAGLRRIVGAASVGCVIDVDFTPTGRGRSSGIALDGWDTAALVSFAVVAQKGSTFHPAVQSLMRRTPRRLGGSVTATREQLVDDRAWYGSPFVEGYLSHSYLDPGLFSSFRLEAAKAVSGLGLYREKNDRPFSDAERALVELFHIECAGLLHGRRSPLHEVVGSDLPRRARETLANLLRGLSDKEIASRMQISPHTVNHYTKVLYRHFNVSSRATLIARCAASRHP